jgi:hypothetical protein
VSTYQTAGNSFSNEKMDDTMILSSVIFTAG